MNTIMNCARCKMVTFYNKQNNSKYCKYCLKQQPLLVNPIPDPTPKPIQPRSYKYFADVLHHFGIRI